MPVALVALLLLFAPLPGKSGKGSNENGGASVSVTDHSSQQAPTPGSVKPASKPGGDTSPSPVVQACDPWAADPPPAPGPNASVRELLQYRRVCPSQVQYMVTRVDSGQAVAMNAYASAVARAVKPTLLAAPPTDHLIVNLETWFAVQRTAPVSATASIPGLSATVTLRPASYRVDTGAGTVLRCSLWGSTTSPAGGCTWTPTVPSIPRFTRAGYAFAGSVTLVWDVSWSATDGSGGRLDAIETTRPIRLAVREIQTIGGTH